MNIINPLATISAGGMMMDTLGEPKIAEAVDQAIHDALACPCRGWGSRTENTAFDLLMHFVKLAIADNRAVCRIAPILSLAEVTSHET